MSIASARLLSLAVLVSSAVTPAVGSANDSRLTEQRAQSPSVETQPSADDVEDFLFRLTSPYNRTRRLFESVYGVRLRSFGFGDAEYKRVISTILEAWSPPTCGLLPRCPDWPFVRPGDALLAALDDAERFVEFWEVLPRDGQLRLAEALRKYHIVLDDGLNRDELERFSPNHDRVQLISLLSEVVRTYR